jgi:hypothetical protein
VRDDGKGAALEYIARERGMGGVHRLEA